MKILLMYGLYFPADAGGGAAAVVRSLGRGLSSKGHEVTLYTSNLGNEPGKRLAPRTFEAFVDGMRVVYLNAVANYHYIPLSPELIPLCFRELKHFDVLQLVGHRQLSNLWASWLAQRWGVPCFLHAVGNLPLRILRSIRKKRLYDSMFSDGLVRRSNRVIASSNQEKRDMVAFGVPDTKIVVIPDPLDLAHFEHLPARGAFRKRYGVPENARLVLFLGRVDPKKNVHLLVEAFAKARRDGAMLAIVGPSNDRHDYLRQIKEIATRLGIQQEVRFIGYLAGEEKVQAYVDADVFVAPSKVENCGHVILEAIAAGTPVIVTNTCGAIEYMDEGTGVVISDPTELPSALAQTLSDPGLLQSMRQKCLGARSKLFLSVSDTIDRYEELYREAILARRN